MMRIDGVGRQHEDCGAFARLAAKALCDLPAIHLRHRYVEEYEVWIGLLDELQAFMSGSSTLYKEAERRKQIADEFALHFVVVHH